MSEPVVHHLVFRLHGVVMQKSLGPACMTPDMGDLLRELSRDFIVWLFCEPSREELAPVMESLQLDQMIPRAHWLFASGRLCAEKPKELIEELMARTGGRREELLWIDDRPAVATAVIRAGMHAVAFVDAFRLRRNLVLRGLVK